MKEIEIMQRPEIVINQVAEKMRSEGIRVKVDNSSDRMGAKIRDAEKLKIPYMLVVGDREQESETVAPRLRSGAQLDPIKIDDLLNRMSEEIKNHAQV